MLASNARTAPRGNPTGSACWQCERRLRRLGSSYYADSKRLYVGLVTDSVNYPHGVDPMPSRPARPSGGSAEPRRDFARYVRCRGVQRDGPIIRVFTSAPRAASPGAEKLRHEAGHDVAMPQLPPVV